MTITQPEKRAISPPKPKDGTLCRCGCTIKRHYGQGGNLGCDDCTDCLKFVAAPPKVKQQEATL